MSQQPRTMIIRVGHAPEMAPIHIRHSVVAGQPLIDERVVCPQHVEHAVIFVELAVEEHLGLLAERLP